MPITVFVMVDGLRPDVLAIADCPHIHALRMRGAATMTASSVVPSITLPCHISIFHSVPPARHGIVSNDWQPMARPLPGLIEQAKVAGKRCYFFHNWEPLRNLNQPENLSFSYYRDNCYTPDGDQIIAQEAARTIAGDQPDFAFVYLGTVDVAGHAYGWMSAEYIAQAERVDKAVGTVLNALPADSTVLLHSDHGGHERTHGAAIPEDMTIPWMIAGPGIRQGYELTEPVSLLDTAPTLAHILGAPAHPQWEGRCVMEVFE